MVSIHAPLVKDRGCYFVGVDVDYGLRSRNACLTLAKALRLVEARIEGNGQWERDGGGRRSQGSIGHLTPLKASRQQAMGIKPAEASGWTVTQKKKQRGGRRVKDSQNKKIE